MTDRRPLPRRVVRSVVRRAAPPVRRLLAERDDLRRELEQAQDLAGPDSRSYEYVFVMTYGRSGSTLLQAILNSTPGVMIRGENRGIVYRLHQFHSSAMKDAAWAGENAHRPVNPWFGIKDYAADVALTHIRQLVLDTLLRPGPKTRVTGFKEIRWYEEDLAEYVGFLQQVFPGARFVVNTRSLDDVAKSSWWADRDDPLDQLRVIEDRILRVAHDLGGAAYRVHYDDYVADPTVLSGMFSWLGLPWDETRVRQVMERSYAKMPDSPAPREG